MWRGNWQAHIDDYNPKTNEHMEVECGPGNGKNAMCTIHILFRIRLREGVVRKNETLDVNEVMVLSAQHEISVEKNVHVFIFDILYA